MNAQCFPSKTMILSNNVKNDFILNTNFVKLKRGYFMSDILKVNYNFKKRQNYKILKSLNKENITKLFFYTHYQNLLKILEYGIQISSQLQINEGDSYEI